MKWYGYAAFAFVATFSFVSAAQAAEPSRLPTVPTRGTTAEVTRVRTASVAKVTPVAVKPVASANSQPGKSAPRAIAPQSVARVGHVEAAEVSHPHHHGAGYNAYTQGVAVAPWRANNPWAGSWPVPYDGYVYSPGACDWSAPCTKHLWDGYVQCPLRCHPHHHCARGCKSCGINAGCQSCQQGDVTPSYGNPGPVPTPAPAPVPVPPAAEGKPIAIPVPVVSSDDVGPITIEGMAEGEQIPDTIELPADESASPAGQKEARGKLTKLQIRSVSVPVLKPAQ